MEYYLVTLQQPKMVLFQYKWDIYFNLF